MLFAHLPSALARLAVNQPGVGDTRNIRDVFRQPFVNAGAQQAAKQHIQTLALPPAVHIAFAKAQRSFLQHPFKHLRIIHLNIKRLVAVNRNAGFRQHLFNDGVPAIFSTGQCVNTSRIHNNPQCRRRFNKHSRKLK